MALTSEPSLLELSRLVGDEDQLVKFLEANGLLCNPVPIGYTRKGKPFFALCSGKPFNRNRPNCTGRIVMTMKGGRLPKFQCTVCVCEISRHNGLSAIDAAAPSTGKGFFSHKDALNRPNRKIDPRELLYFIWLTAYGQSPSMLRALTGSGLNKNTCVDWGNYTREIIAMELENSPKMGGPGVVIEVDESYMAGRRKYNRGRLLRGNAMGAGNARNNYLARARGPWIFGILCRASGECRMFFVADRTISTLIPLIRKHVAVGSHIYSDEWLPYRSVTNFGYQHSTVNHSQNFLNPRSRIINTQKIERMWRTLRTPLLRLGPGLVPGTIKTQLAKYWWFSRYGRTRCTDPFIRLVNLISKYYQV